MPEALKNIYQVSFFEQILEAAPFERRQFLDLVFDSRWDQLELKQRMRHIAQVFQQLLPGPYEEQIAAIHAIIKHLLRRGYRENTFEMMFFPDFIEQYGLAHYDASVKALEQITQFTSCEFAVRPFIIKYPGPMMLQMLDWSRHEHANVRRFSSEGCRPRLPWAMALPALKKDPSPILPILENLKADESEFVRRSVANNLNDIAKDHPALVLEIAGRWQGVSASSDWVVRHACRSLIKQGRPEALKLFGMEAGVSATIHGLELSSPQVALGNYLAFQFKLQLQSSTGAKLRIEYGIDYLKANGRHHTKKFKLSEAVFEPGQTYELRRRQLFKDLTTRKHYAGLHRLIIFVNGQAMAQTEFDVLI